MSKRRNIGGRNNEKELSPLLFISRCVLLLFIFFICYLLISLVLSAFLYSTDNPTKNIHIYALSCGCVSSFLSGLTFSKVNGQKWLLSGIILGGLIDLMILIMGPLVSDTVNSYVRYALIPIFCVFGAFLGKKHVKRRKHSRHR